MERPILRDVEQWISRNGMKPTKFGILALRDPRLVFDLRNGRNPSRRTRARIRAFMLKGAN